MGETLLERLRTRAATPGPEEPPTLNFPDSLPYLRASSIRTYLRCPRQFWYVYVQGMRERPGAAATAGTAMHRAAELGLREKMESGENPDPEDSAQAAAETAGELVAKGDVVFDNGVPDAGALTDRAVGLARRWAIDYAPEIKPTAVEERWEKEIAGVPMSGTIDVVEHDGHISDWKTTGRTPNAADVLGNPQAGIYLASRERNIGLSFRYLVFKKPTKARPEPEITTKTVAVVGAHAGEAVRLARSTVLEVARGVSAEVFPRSREGWHCSPERCGFFARCMSGKDRP